MGKPRRPLPIPSNCPPLSRQATEVLRSRALSTAMDVVAMAQVGGGPIQWRVWSREGDLIIYQGEDPSGPYNVCPMMGWMEIPGSLDEVADLFRTDTLQHAAEYTQRFCPDVDAVLTLYTIAQPKNLNDDMISVTWRASKSGSSPFALKRDMCLLECHHAFQLENNRRGRVCAVESIDMPCCPDFQAEHGYRRTQVVSSGHVFVESRLKSGYLELSYVVRGDLSTASSLGRWLAVKAMAKRCRSIKAIDAWLRQNRVNRTPFLPVAKVVPHRSRRQCHLCRKVFHAFTRKTTCFKCGEVLCSPCTTPQRVEIDGKKRRLDVCTSCSIRPPEIKDVGLIETTAVTEQGSDDGGWLRQRPRRAYSAYVTRNDFEIQARSSLPLLSAGEVVRSPIYILGQ
ncbi:hypothetical protein AeNC1_009542 [Aphanomyces euteiches]|nr:hypothetical protein AeNC1_009542 [Aphanomyces euteiches]